MLCCWVANRHLVSNWYFWQPQWILVPSILKVWSPSSWSSLPTDFSVLLSSAQAPPWQQLGRLFPSRMFCRAEGCYLVTYMGKQAKMVKLPKEAWSAMEQLLKSCLCVNFLAGWLSAWSCKRQDSLIVTSLLWLVLNPWYLGAVQQLLSWSSGKVFSRNC